ncbi:MAG: universal stress protein [Thermodesulfobacteriota bacterium]|nr:universal stress protein [Thermodesulfobacteriota bacterium]
MAKKILVAVDDSENAGRAVNFLADNFVRDLQITLLSVCPDTATLCEMDSPALIPYFKSRQSDFCVLEDKKKKIVREALDGAREKLVEKGFSPENIEVKLLTKNEGIARDIVAEGILGYDLIIMGRRGLSGVKGFFLGSISQKVINMAKDISVLIVN